jgi:alpha-ribazole phosphatase
MIQARRDQDILLRLVLVRHGQTDWNLDGRWQGQTDVPLNATGLAQAQAVGLALAGRRLDAIYASDLQRAHMTAEAVAAHHSVSVIPEPRLREINLGDWEGLTFDQLAARDQARMAQWVENAVEATAPNGESQRDLLARVWSLLDDLRQRPVGETVLLVAHGGTLRSLLCLALGVPPQNHWRFSVSSTSISELHLYADGAMLTRFNDQHHLDGLADG